MPWRTLMVLLGFTASRGGSLGNLALLFLLIVGGVVGLAILALITSR